MKKIMFNDKCFLTKMVLEGKKTMTRRVTRQYEVGETIAVMQSYLDVLSSPMTNRKAQEFKEKLKTLYHTDNFKEILDEPGTTNKMFAKASAMIHYIKITDMRIERIQDITDEECLKEGIFIDEEREFIDNNLYAFDVKGKHLPNRWWWPSAKMAFGNLIDRTMGKGIWERNPQVFAYTFKLVK